MAGIFVNGGLNYMDTVPIATDAQNWYVALYNNNKTPAATDTLSDYTLIVAGGVVAIKPGFTVGGASGGSKALTSAIMNFICTGNTGGSAYGYVVMDPSQTILIGAEKFSGGPYAMTSAGQGVQLTSVLTDSSP